MRSSGHDRRHKARRDGNRWTILAIAVVLALGVAIGLYWFFSQGPGSQLLSPPGSDIAQFSGDGSQTTQSFQVRGQWQVDWANTGERFAFAIAGEQDLGTIIQQEDPGSGVTTVVAGGTFHLEIEAEGPWEVRITQGD